MKFLIFNIAVTVALVYLLTDEGKMPWLRDATSRAKTMIEEATFGVSEAEKSNGQAAPKQIGKVAPAVRVKVASEGKPISIESVGAAKPAVIDTTQRLDPELKPRLMSPKHRSLDEKNNLTPLVDPVTVDMRRSTPVQVSNRTPTAIPPSINSGDGEPTRVIGAPKFMTPLERSRELSKLARSAENLFLDRLAK